MIVYVVEINNGVVNVTHSVVEAKAFIEDFFKSSDASWTWWNDDTTYMLHYGHDATFSAATITAGEVGGQMGVKIKEPTTRSVHVIVDIDTAHYKIPNKEQAVIELVRSMLSGKEDFPSDDKIDVYM